MKAKKNKRGSNNIIITIIFIVVGVALFGYLGYRVYNDFFKDNAVRKPVDSIELYEYTLSSNDTEIYKTYFKELTAILNEKPINYSEYAKCISKLFIIDVYTLDNKLGSAAVHVSTAYRTVKYCISCKELPPAAESYEETYAAHCMAGCLIHLDLNCRILIERFPLHQHIQQNICVNQ